MFQPMPDTSNREAQRTTQPGGLSCRHPKGVSTSTGESSIRGRLLPRDVPLCGLTTSTLEIPLKRCGGLNEMCPIVLRVQIRGSQLGQLFRQFRRSRFNRESTSLEVEIEILKPCTIPSLLSLFPVCEVRDVSSELVASTARLVCHEGDGF